MPAFSWLRRFLPRLFGAAKATAPAGSIDLERLPSVVALPLQHYRAESHPHVKLWQACEVIEFLLRLIVMLGLADLRQRGQLDGQLLAKLRQHIELPTLGKWERMAIELAKVLRSRPDAFARQLADLVEKGLVPLLDGPPETRPTVTTSFRELRNQLAHSGLNRRTAEELLAVWQQPFEVTVNGAGWLADLDLVVCDAQGRFGKLRGPRTSPEPYQPANDAMAVALNDLIARSEKVAVVRDREVLPLWPLALYGLPRLPDPEAARSDRPLAQVYVRRGEVGLQFTPLSEAEAVCQTEGDETALQEFRRLFAWTPDESADGPAASGSRLPG